MSRQERVLPSLGRAARRERDDRIFVVATEDTYVPKQYFEALALSRVRVLVLETRDKDSAPSQVVERLRAAFDHATLRKERAEADEFWVLVDTDHHFAPNHTRGTVMALDAARQRGFGIAVSNPCFEVWLVLHHEDCVEPFAHADDVCARLRARLGSYNKTRLDSTHFTLSGARSAITRARPGAQPQRSIKLQRTKSRITGVHAHGAAPRRTNLADRRALNRYHDA